MFKTVKNINRLGEVINILVKYSFEDVVANSALKKIISAQKQVSIQYAGKPYYDYSRWERIRMVIEELGATAIKLAQFLSNRPDILPEPLIKEFQKLQAKVPPFSSKTAKAIIEKETGKKIDELFSYFDNYTIGAASIGQVHRVRLKTGEDVVVKVQRPQAKRQVTTDLRLLREFIKLTENYFQNHGILNPVEIIDTFEDTMLKELDYTTEIKNTQRFWKIFSEFKHLQVPKPYLAYSTSKILTLQFISGCKITDVEQLKKWGLSPKIIVERALKIYLAQVFKYGLFHADPHSGNILIYPNGNIAFIDFGMIGRLSKRQKFQLADLFIALSSEDAKAMATSIRRLSIKSEIDDFASFENDLQELIDDFIVLDIGLINIKELIVRLQKIFFKYKLQMPGSIFLIFRALSILDGIGKQIHPNFNPLKFIKSATFRVLKEKYSPKNLKSELQFSIAQILSLFYSSPIDLKYIIQKIRSGNISANIKITGFEIFLKKIDTFVNKIVFTLIIVALILGSAIIMLAKFESIFTLFGIPIYSLVGFAFAIILIFWLLFYTIRNRN